jgi:hypothetical protein
MRKAQGPDPHHAALLPRQPGDTSDGIFDGDLLVRRWRRVGAGRVARIESVLDA